ncbi:hypothetical protein IW140_006398 [Coemansia sp. RSA 1813]|nr:hypothetical protein LPJ74_006260 [Coemansia sp. RSA 1843]KAJ2085430.1 hypothetical protein IW138_006338 [Coemansia sp. RSA 986]KAJ2210329.1 hypothetical protein EV179_006321 [Coemansia sp. RSA 487]KAJ2562554.1 hypothetical protein IW140_006398 [Coemansia sp. RSA 1813]
MRARCDGEQPVCGRCKSHRTECNYRQSGRFRKRFPRDQMRTSTGIEHQQDGTCAIDPILAATALSTVSEEDEVSPILFMLPPELSPTGAAGMELSPESAGLETPLVDPMAVLRTRDLPDLVQGLSEPIAQQMAGLIGGFTDTSNEKLNGGKLPPNLALLDPRNAATNTLQYTANGGAPDWLRTEDPLRYLETDVDNVALTTLHDVAQRYGLQANAATLLSMLRASFVDSATRMRTRQFWATLNVGRAGDFAVLAHVAIAAREAQLSSRQGNAIDAGIEGTCFDAAQREWSAGHVVATTGAVYGLLLLSEYGFQTGRTSVLWDYAMHAIATVRLIQLRGHAYPWRGARTTECDLEYEHMLACFWCAWARVYTAAQALARHIEDSEATLPEMPLHNLCHDIAQPFAIPGDPPGAVQFAPAACHHSSQCSYMAATWRCCLMTVPVHNCHVDLLERNCTPAHFFATLRAWDDRLQAWRMTWHPAWEPRLSSIMGTGRGPLSSALQSPTDSWLIILAVMYATLRLRMHRVALALLLRADERPLLPGAALAPPPPATADESAAYQSLTGDALRDAIDRHRCHFVCLESANDLQVLLAACNRVGLPLTRFGIWVVFVLEQVASVHCTRTGRREGTVTQLDAVHRLSMVMRHLVALRKWTAALYVFTSIVKALLVDEDPEKMTVALDCIPESCRTGLCQMHFQRVENSPWPQNHVLTMLIRELGMLPRQFCAYTVPVVYASIMTSSAPIPSSVRMRIASLLS